MGDITLSPFFVGGGGALISEPMYLNVSSTFYSLGAFTTPNLFEIPDELPTIVPTPVPPITAVQTASTPTIVATSAPVVTQRVQVNGAVVPNVTST
jgi:hypothetical protein